MGNCKQRCKLNCSYGALLVSPNLHAEPLTFFCITSLSHGCQVFQDFVEKHLKDGAQIAEDFKLAWDAIHEQEFTEQVVEDQGMVVDVEDEHMEASIDSSIHP